MAVAGSQQRERKNENDEIRRASTVGGVYKRQLYALLVVYGLLRETRPSGISVFFLLEILPNRHRRVLQVLVAWPGSKFAHHGIHRI